MATDSSPKHPTPNHYAVVLMPGQTPQVIKGSVFPTKQVKDRMKALLGGKVDFTDVKVPVETVRVLRTTFVDEEGKKRRTNETVVGSTEVKVRLFYLAHTTKEPSPTDLGQPSAPQNEIATKLRLMQNDGGPSIVHGPCVLVVLNSHVPDKPSGKPTDEYHFENKKDPYDLTNDLLRMVTGIYDVQTGHDLLKQKPKRLTNPLNLYATEVWQKNKAEREALGLPKKKESPLKDRSVRAEEWKNMSEEEKQPYVEQFETLKTKWEAELAQVTQRHMDPPKPPRKAKSFFHERYGKEVKWEDATPEQKLECGRLEEEAAKDWPDQVKVYQEWCEREGVDFVTRMGQSRIRQLETPTEEDAPPTKKVRKTVKRPQKPKNGETTPKPTRKRKVVVKPKPKPSTEENMEEV